MDRDRRSRRRGWRAAATVVAVGVVLLAGCSSDGSSEGARSRPATTAGPATAGAPGTYVSIGDSYAQGYQPAPEGQQADYRDGYAYLLPEAAKAKGYDLTLVNFGCGGATVGSLADDPGCQAGARAPDGPAYETTQLDAALAYLAAHQGEVRVLTVSIGGNDVTACVRAADPITCVTGAVAHIEEGLKAMLPELRAAAGPDTVIVGLTYPDVILGSYLAGGADAERLAGLSVTAFQQLINPMLKEEYEAVDGTFVDVTAGTGAYTPLTETTTLAPYGEIPEAVAQVCTLTWFCERQDIHPRSVGYAKITDLIVAALPEPR
ncbi:hypothetical protein BH10ACT1_BH10ACT1_27520 [soil metagenome]